jgi:hypothetical protein
MEQLARVQRYQPAPSVLRGLPSLCGTMCTDWRALAIRPPTLLGVFTPQLAHSDTLSAQGSLSPHATPCSYRNTQQPGGLPTNASSVSSSCGRVSALNTPSLRLFEGGTEDGTADHTDPESLARTRSAGSNPTLIGTADRGAILREPCIMCPRSFRLTRTASYPPVAAENSRTVSIHYPLTEASAVHSAAPRHCRR